MSSLRQHVIEAAKREADAADEAYARYITQPRHLQDPAEATRLMRDAEACYGSYAELVHNVQ